MYTITTDAERNLIIITLQESLSRAALLNDLPKDIMREAGKIIPNVMKMFVAYSQPPRTFRHLCETKADAMHWLDTGQCRSSIKAP